MIDVLNYSNFDTFYLNKKNILKQLQFVINYSKDLQNQISELHILMGV